MTAAPLQDHQPRPRPLPILLLSTYELGHQPFGLASPAAWLRADGGDVTCVDLAVESLSDETIVAAGLIAVYLPMHTATRLAVELIPRLRRLNPTAHLCAYGLYAPVNEELLRERGVDTVLGGEFEAPLAALATQLAFASFDESPPGRQMLPVISLDRQTFRPPDRAGLPELHSYATLRLADGTERVVGYTEASRGCKHLSRHCPIVPVYGGRFRVVQRDVVDADIAALVRAGAQHITFGDPDFFNGSAHAMAVVERLHERFPTLSYDVTIKVEHLLSRAALLPALRDTGCVLITTAVESFDDAILDVFDKRHTRADLVTALRILGEAGIAVNPTFVAFTPWTARETYADFLSAVCELGLVETVSAVQYAIRLLVPAGSRLLDVASLRRHLRDFDAVGLCHRWTHPDPLMDQLQVDLFAIAEEAITTERSRRDVFDRVREHTADLFGGQAARRLRALRPAVGVTPAVPYLSEPWFCCAEPVRSQLEPML